MAGIGGSATAGAARNCSKKWSRLAAGVSGGFGAGAGTMVVATSGATDLTALRRRVAAIGLRLVAAVLDGFLARFGFAGGNGFSAGRSSAGDGTDAAG
jgi:hypothetical protein